MAKHEQMLLKIWDSFKPVFCDKTAATLLESQLMWYSWLRTALHGAIQAVIKVKEDRKSVLWRRISWMGFQTDLPNFPFPREPSNPIQKWKPFFYSRFSQLDPKKLYKSSRLPAYNESGASIFNNPKKDEVRWWFKRTSESRSAWYCCWIWIQGSFYFTMSLV